METWTFALHKLFEFCCLVTASFWKPKTCNQTMSHTCLLLKICWKCLNVTNMHGNDSFWYRKNLCAFEISPILSIFGCQIELHCEKSALQSISNSNSNNTMLIIWKDSSACLYVSLHQLLSLKLSDLRFRVIGTYKTGRAYEVNLHFSNIFQTWFQSFNFLEDITQKLLMPSNSLLWTITWLDHKGKIMLKAAKFH